MKIYSKIPTIQDGKIILILGGTIIKDEDEIKVIKEKLFLVKIEMRKKLKMSLKMRTREKLKRNLREKQKK